MAQKLVVFTFSHPPYGSIWYTEGLRAVVGVTAGSDEHKVNVVYMGDGVHFALNGVDRSDTAKYLGTLAQLGYKLNVERESLQARDIPESEVAPDVEVIPRSQVLSLIRDADATIDF